jgi:uncharacterized protein YggE
LNGITYTLSDSKSAETAARKAAYNAATSRAAQYAQLSNRKIGKILLVD